MNTALKSSVKKMEKEEVKYLFFPNKDVLDSKEEKQTRYLNIIRGMKLGNMLKSKISIFFSDNEGKKKVETTIWGVTEKNIILKQGTIIPIHRIHTIGFF